MRCPIGNGISDKARYEPISNKKFISLQALTKQYYTRDSSKSPSKDSSLKTLC